MSLWTDQGYGWQKAPLARDHNPFAAFLCCPGPSLATISHDLRGPGRTIYALNTAYPHIKPDVWLGLDCVECFDGKLWHESFMKVCRKWESTDKMRLMPNTYFADLEEFPVAEMFLHRENGTSFIWQKNSLIFAIHFLIWRGHRKIYLIGCDMGGEKDYHDDRVLTEDQRANNKRLYAAQVKTLRELMPVAERNGVEICCCTENSPLNEFMDFQMLGQIIYRAELNWPQPTPVQHVMDAVTERNVVLVLKEGGDFNEFHVSRLVNQLPRNCSVTLLTDSNVSDPFGCDGVPIRTIRLKYNWPSWWSKMEMFSPTLMPDKPFLYIDLDTTIKELPDAFFTQLRTTFLGPFENLDYTKLQTGLMWLMPAERRRIWNKWREQPDEWMRNYDPLNQSSGGCWGDQGFIRKSCGFDAHNWNLKWQIWQDVIPGAIQSYKFNLLTNKDRFGNPVDKSKIKVLCFHGKPRPWELSEDPLK